MAINQECPKCKKIMKEKSPEEASLLKEEILARCEDCGISLKMLSNPKIIRKNGKDILEEEREKVQKELEDDLKEEQE